MHALIAPGLAIVFIGWLIYHGLIKKDIKKYRNEAYGGLIILGLWVVIYYGLIVLAS